MAFVPRTLRSQVEPSASRPRCQWLRWPLRLRASLFAVCLLVVYSQRRQSSASSECLPPVLPRPNLLRMAAGI
jgi:type VI protein secretion system component VasF